jgi:hypothetical protein
MTTFDRRVFLKCAASAAAFSTAWPGGLASAASAVIQPVTRPKKPALVRGAFFYPPAQVVLEGRAEDSWSKHEWFTWPGNQFKPEEQQAKFMTEIRQMTEGLDLQLAIDEQPLYTDAAISAFLEDVLASKPDALLLFNFWNSFSAKVAPLLEAFEGPIILYHPVGANHQLPPEAFRKAQRTQYIHSIEHWGALERGLRSVHAWNRMSQSKVLRVSGKVDAELTEQETVFGMPIHFVPASHFNDLFDSIEMTTEMEALAGETHSAAKSITDLEEKAFLDAVRAHVAVKRLMERHEADAITIECLFLKHRKPCLSFALNNGALVPCGCENDLSATLSLMLGASLFGRGGFQHNPEFDTEENRYFASHCTCTTQLHGPGKEEAPFALRPFFHQMPKTLALDVKWPPGEAVTLFKHHSNKRELDAWAGEVIDSPECPPTGGCATRVLAKIHQVADVCDIYPGPHPVLFCGDFARNAKTFAQLYEFDLKTNV